MLETEHMKKAVVIDATKLFMLAKFVCKGRGEIGNCFEFLKKSEVVSFASELTVKRAFQSFLRKNSECKDVEEEYFGKINSLVDEIVETTQYEEFLNDADEILKDSDSEKEDTHVLALAMYLCYKGNYDVVIWTDDNDFIKCAKEINERFGIKVKKILEL